MFRQRLSNYTEVPVKRKKGGRPSRATSQACGLEDEEPTVPWEWSAYLSKRRKPPPQSKQMLQDIINRKVIKHFDSILKAHKEKLITRWTRKKRDFVDEILVKESHHEEADWTNYEEDEAFVKNDTTKQILEKLLDETVQLLSYILNRKKLYAAAL
ncbi:hypothetical protein C0J52_10394 [Blattella germanica]|nr:hypothetical protein C0J52_10394 [Blattella germanica]